MYSDNQGFYGTDQGPTNSGNSVNLLNSYKRPFLEIQEAYHKRPEASTHTSKRPKQDCGYSTGCSSPESQYIPSNSNSPAAWLDIVLGNHVPLTDGSPLRDLSPCSEIQDMIPARQRPNAHAGAQFDSPSPSSLPQTPFPGDHYLPLAPGYEDHIGIDNMRHIEGDEDVTMREADTGSPEICFGMIQDANITSSRTNLRNGLITPDERPGKGKKEKKPAIVSVVIQPRKLLTTIHLPSGEYVGLLDSRSSKGISLLPSSVRFQAFLPATQDPPTENITESTQQRQTRQELVILYINIYGPRNIIDLVGKVLSSNEVYLQHPKHNDKGLGYKNPHYFTGIEDDSICSPNRVPIIRLQGSIEERNKTLFELSLNTSLPEAEPGNQLKTPLLSHQKQAVYFMLQKEGAGTSGIGGYSPISFWKQEKGGDGCIRYINSITKEITPDQPQSVNGGILADEMGLGKSLTALSLITSTMDQARIFGMTTVNTSTSHTTKPRLQTKATLIVAPASLLDSWREQIDMHIKPGALRVHIYHGAQREMDPKKLIDFDIVITTYSIIRVEVFPKRPPQLCKKTLSDIRWFRIVLDEAHIIREGSTQQSKALCLLEAQRRWCLTGTPIQNKLQDFGTLLRFLRFLPFDNEASFNHHIIKPLKMADPGGLKRLRLLIGSTCLRRNKNILDLPPRTDQIQYIHFEAADRRLYEDCKKDSARLIEHALAGSSQCTYFGILQSILRLRLLCDHSKELLPVELGHRLGEYLNTKQPASESSHVNDYIEIQIPNTPSETGIVECGMCNELIGPTETEVGSFTSCSHSICSRCSMVYESDPVPSQLVSPSCPICVAAEGCSLGTSGQAGLGWMKDIRYNGPSTKVKALIENLRNFKAESAGEPAKSVIFSCWTKMLDLIGLALISENMRFVRFDGSLSIQQRKEAINCFRDDPQVEILLISIGSGSVGLNLTAASRVHLMEPQWNPMVEQQALDRLYRIGQKKEVIATRYIVKNSIEESILAFQQRKLALANLSLSQSSLTEKGNHEHLKDLRALFN